MPWLKAMVISLSTYSGVGINPWFMSRMTLQGTQGPGDVGRETLITKYGSPRDSRIYGVWSMSRCF